ncbi:MAG: HAD family phosphatase, partial [Acidobacteria bacterium]|nr:HAD family phosphatase [Acidobacteriota bacterium]
IQLLFTDAILALQECKTHLMDQFGDRATILETTYPERDHVFVDVIHASCSKGKTLQWLMRREHLLPRQVMAFGDNHNDLEMLEIAGHSFLMDNAAEDLKRLGFRIAPRNDADGVARVIHEYWK